MHIDHLGLDGLDFDFCTKYTKEQPILRLGFAK